MRRALATSLFLAVLSGSPAARAERLQFLVLKLEAESFAPELQTALDEAIREGLTRSKRGKVLPAPALDFNGLSVATGCIDEGPDCLLSIGRALGANRVIRAVLVGTAQQATLTLTVVGARRNRPQIYEAKLDEISLESSEEVAWHVLTALGNRPKPLVGSVQLAVVTSGASLEGAEYFLDDKKVPRSALDNLVAGRHRLEVHQRGFDTFIWIGVVKKGRVLRVEVDLKSKGGAIATAPPPPSGLEDPPPIDDTTPSIGSPPPPPPSIQDPPPSIAITTERGDAPIVYAYVVAAAAVVAAGVGVGFVLYGRNAEAQLKEQAMDGVLGPQYRACTVDQDAAACEPFQPLLDRLDVATTANIASFVTAGVLAAGAVGVFFLERSLGGESDVAVGVAPTDGGAAASVSLTF